MTDAFVETSFVIALINKSDKYHDLALQLTNRFEGRTLVTTDAVLFEIGNALSRNFKQESVQIIEHFLSSDDVRVIHLRPAFVQKSI